MSRINKVVVRGTGIPNYSKDRERIISMNIYCTYITAYKGNKLPPFYIGSSSVNKIKNGYHGSVSSKLYKNIWNQEIKFNPHLFTTKIISIHHTSKDARQKELKFHNQFNVVKSEMYINRALAKPNGFHGSDVSKENHPRWGSHHSEESKKKIGYKNQGKIPHNKGIPMSQKNKDRIILTKKLNPRPAPNKGMKMNYSAEALANMCRAKTWKLQSPNGEHIVVKNLRNFCQQNSLPERAFRDVAKNPQKTYKGWRCSYL
jgi:hypothetical protein